MNGIKRGFWFLIFALYLFAISLTWAQVDVGDLTISGSAEVGGLPRTFKGDKAWFEQYRDIPESVIVPQLQLLIGGKKEEYYLNYNAVEVGRHDQGYNLRVGRYGLVDMEFSWDQILQPRYGTDSVWASRRRRYLYATIQTHDDSRHRRAQLGERCGQPRRSETLQRHRAV